MATRFADHLLEGDHASRPVATAVPTGTLYSCSDHDLIYQSDGAAWSTWATVGGAGSVSAASVSFTPAGTIAATDVQAAIEEVASEAGSASAAGRAAYAFPPGFNMVQANSNAISVADGGAIAVQVIAPAPMYVNSIAIRFSVSSSKTGEARLYVDNGDATVDYVTGVAVTQTAETIGTTYRGVVSGAPVAIDPGHYWLVWRNASGGAVNVARSSMSTLTNIEAYRTIASVSALGASLDLDTSWSAAADGLPAMWVDGRVIGKTTYL